MIFLGISCTIFSSNFLSLKNSLKQFSHRWLKQIQFELDHWKPPTIDINNEDCHQKWQQFLNKRTVVILTSDKFLRKGLQLVGFDHAGRQQRVCRATNLMRFRAHYGSNPVVYAQIWEDLQMTVALDDAKKMDPDSFLIALHFLTSRCIGSCRRSKSCGNKCYFSRLSQGEKIA